MHPWGVHIAWMQHPPLPGMRTARAYEVVPMRRESRGQSRYVRSTRESQCGAQVELNARQETPSVSHTQAYEQGMRGMEGVGPQGGNTASC
jgi:hypothetical protein